MKKVLQLLRPAVLFDLKLQLADLGKQCIDRRNDSIRIYIICHSFTSGEDLRHLRVYCCVLLTLLKPMNVSNKFDTVKSEWFIVYMYNEGRRSLSPNLCCISFSDDRYGICRQWRPKRNAA